MCGCACFLGDERVGWNGTARAVGGAVEAEPGRAGQGEAGEEQDQEDSQHEHRLEVSVLFYLRRGSRARDPKARPSVT